ncbi:hypothetical protein D3C72_606890 [compost metagenome]
MQCGAERQDLVVEVVAAVVQEGAAAGVLADAQIGTGLLLQHEGKIFRAHAGLQVAVDVLRADQRLRHVGREHRFGRGVDRGRVDAFVLDRRGRAKAGGNGRAQLAQSLLDLRLHARAEGAHGADQRGLARDHAHRAEVAGLHGADADDGRVDGTHAARHDGLRRGDDVRGHHDGVDGLVSMRAVAALALDLDRHAVGRSHHRAAVDADGAGRHRGPVVHRIDSVHREAVEQAVFDHHARTGQAFFAGLEDQHGGAVEVARLGQVARGADQHGGVAVVAAAVHQTVVGRAPAEVVVLAHGQRVHVGAQADHAAAGRRLAADDADDTGLADALVDLVHAAGAQCFAHAARRVDLFEAELGVGMQVAAKGRDLGVEAGDVREGPAGGLQARRCGSGCDTHLNGLPPCPRAAGDRPRSTTGRPRG